VSDSSGVGRAPKASAVRQDEHAELERLRAEVAELRGRPPRSGSRHRRIGWRGPAATALIVLGCLLAPVSVLAVWSANQVSDTSRYIANIEPLVHDPAIQKALTDKITFQVSRHLNIGGYTAQAAAALTSRGLPRAGGLLKAFAPAIAGAVAGFVHSTVHKIVTSPQFARAWTQANTVAHRVLVKALSGQGGAVSVQNGQVTIDLAPFIDIVKQSLARRGFTIVNSLPAIHPTLGLFEARYLVRAQTAYRLINDLKFVLPIVSVLLIAAGVYVARRHRQALIGAGLGFGASMLVLAVGLAIFRTVYLSSVPPRVLPADAAAALFDTLVRFIKDGLRLLLVTGLVVALGAFFTGPSVTATRTRRAIASGLGWIRARGERAGLSTGPAGRWTYTHRTGLRIGAVALAAIIFVFSLPGSVVGVIVLVLVLLFVLGLIELVGRPSARPQTAGQA
jgi:hypothetical protein